MLEVCRCTMSEELPNPAGHKIFHWLHCLKGKLFMFGQHLPRSHRMIQIFYAMVHMNVFKYSLFMVFFLWFYLTYMWHYVTWSTLNATLCVNYFYKQNFTPFKQFFFLKYEDVIFMDMIIKRHKACIF